MDMTKNVNTEKDKETDRETDTDRDKDCDRSLHLTSTLSLADVSMPRPLETKIYQIDFLLQ
jgi:hypothetical protein